MANVSKKVIDQIARQFGVTIMPIWRMEAHPFADFLRRLFELYSIDCVIDIGANRGQYRDFLRLHVGFNGQIISYEPDPECAGELKERASRDERWHVEAMALGSRRGELPLKIMMDSQFNSFLSPDNSIVTDRLRNRVIREVVVPISTLDEQASALSSIMVGNKYLKIDTQGYDLEVLKGATGCLPGIRALQTEASVRPIYKDMPDFRQALSFLEAAGFALSNAFPIVFDAGLRAIEFDYILVNARCADEISRQAKP